MSLHHHDDDDYSFDLDNDPALSAAVEAVERRARAPPTPPPPQQPRPQRIEKPAPPAPSTAPAQSINPAPQPSAPPKQPLPQRITKGSSSKILVSTRQRGNPLLTHIKSVPWEYDDQIIPDYVLNETTCALFLSLKYHKLHPDYIYHRLRHLPQTYTLRLLLTLLDIPTTSSTAPLKELTTASLPHSFTLLLTFTPVEAAHYLTAYKTLSHTAPTVIQERRPEEYAEQVVRFFTTIKGVNKNDAGTLVANFGSVRDALGRDEGMVRILPGWGRTKAERLRRVVEAPFHGGEKQKRRERMRERFGEGVEEDEEAIKVVREMEERERGVKRRLEEEEEEKEEGNQADKDANRDNTGDVMAALQRIRESAGAAR